MKDAESFLDGVGAIDKEARRAFPTCVYMNPKDYKKLERNVIQAFKKKYPYLNSNKLKSSVGMYMLNLGPVEVEGIKEGYTVVDECKLECEKAALIGDK